ncbi:MAG TPA: hypothetical protein VIL25_07120, partial [Vicinamibacterales bacterium]
MLVAFAASAVLGWWIKGDLEMGWLPWMLIAPAAGAILGLLAALILRGHAVITTAVGLLSGIIALWAAIVTPHRWAGTDLARLERRAAALADATADVEARARELLGAGVEVSGTKTTVTGGRVVKRPFRFVPDHEPAVATLSMA